jgi:hypothetical protein
MNTRRWNIALTARFESSTMPQDRRAAAQDAALRSRVLMVFGDDSCAARFQVDAADMARALRAAMGRWAHVTEVARLPSCELSRLEAGLSPVDDHVESARTSDADRSIEAVDREGETEDRRLRLVK